MPRPTTSTSPAALGPAPATTTRHVKPCHATSCSVRTRHADDPSLSQPTRTNPCRHVNPTQALPERRRPRRHVVSCPAGSQRGSPHRCNPTSPSASAQPDCPMLVSPSPAYSTGLAPPCSPLTSPSRLAQPVRRPSHHTHLTPRHADMPCRVARRPCLDTPSRPPGPSQPASNPVPPTSLPEPVRVSAYPIDCPTPYVPGLTQSHRRLPNPTPAIASQTLPCRLAGPAQRAPELPDLPLQYRSHHDMPSPPDYSRLPEPGHVDPDCTLHSRPVARQPSPARHPMLIRPYPYRADKAALDSG